MYNYFSFFFLTNIFTRHVFFSIDDTINPSLHPIRSSSLLTQDNGENDRNILLHRKPSVLDEKALREDDTKLVRDQRIQSMSHSYQVILESIGEDPTRQGLSFSFQLRKIIYNSSLLSGLLKTPNRAAEVRMPCITLQRKRFYWKGCSWNLFRRWCFLPKVTNKPYAMSSVMQSLMKNAKTWSLSKKLTCTPSANIICIKEDSLFHQARSIDFVFLGCPSSVKSRLAICLINEFLA